MDSAAIRPATAQDARALTDLALRSKAHWGYDAEFLELCREDLTVTDAHIATRDLGVAVDGGRVLGFFMLGDSGDVLDMLFVEPGAIGRGVGRMLLAEAVRVARGRGIRALLIDSDPFAEGFYLAAGARRIGEVASQSIPGRTLPQLELLVEPLPGHGAGRRPES